MFVAVLEAKGAEPVAPALASPTEIEVAEVSEGEVCVLVGGASSVFLASIALVLGGPLLPSAMSEWS